ncbi:MAG TPA: hypothetical protein VMD09_06915 [Solirubrobacteraceae bacterium]|nr:hypothetical protein [Solirubrobacteraceae bacterium]
MAVSQSGPATKSGGGAQLVRDIATSGLLLNVGRHRALRRVYGSAADHDNALTVFSLLLLPGFLGGVVRRLFKVPKLSNSDLFLLAITLRELLAGAAGPVAQESPGASTLLTLSLAARTPTFGLLEAERGVATSSHWLLGGFRHRYGYLVDPGHRRANRAQRRAQAAGGGLGGPGARRAN